MRAIRDLGGAGEGALGSSQLKRWDVWDCVISLGVVLGTELSVVGSITDTEGWQEAELFWRV